MGKTALVTGGAGQDGWYVIGHLIRHGTIVHAQARRPQPAREDGTVHWHIGDLTSRDACADLIEAVRPDEVYNLASLSRPSACWASPVEAALINAIVPQQICEALLKHCPGARLFQATSSEIFGDLSEGRQNEDTPCNPVSPYGITKLYAHQVIGAYRLRYGLHASSGIMFNHESPRRPLAYVSQKIACAAAAAALGIADVPLRDEIGRPLLSDGRLQLGRLDVRRDFGFAGDYAEIMHVMLQNDMAGDYVIGTGENHSIAELCATAFGAVGRDWREHVEVDPDLIRPVDSRFTLADISKVRRTFGWRPRTSFERLVALMVSAQIAALQTGAAPGAVPVATASPPC